jgi:hypothetical protein
MKMGLDAPLIAIGPFSKAALPGLDYPGDFYAGVQDGATVVANVFNAITSEISHDLASCFGVGAMELGRHHVDASHADLPRLKELFGVEDVTRFVILRDSGFQFYYLPNA